MILTGGCVYFGDIMTVPKFVGVSIAMAGIVWYSMLQLAAPALPAASSQQSAAEERERHAYSK